jgi:hypothetical protein
MTTFFAVTGSRDFPESRSSEITETLDSHFRWHPDTVMLNGMCPTGADKIAYDWAISNGVPVFTFFPDWKAFGKAAGPRRNRAMIKRLLEERSSIVYAFFYGPPARSRGTSDMVQACISSGIEPIEKVVV